MQACLENTALPLLESTLLPSIEPTSLPLADTVPAWTIRVARPAADRNELAKELRGVPKAALCQVFGKALGTRLWQQHRATAPASTATNAAPVATISSSAPTPDTEISTGMLRYLCAEAAAALREHERSAKSVVLTVQYSDGESDTKQQALPHSTSDAVALETAACLALRRMRSDIFVSLKLDVTATAAPCDAPTADLADANAPLSCVA
jgi:hypothetical protein